MRLHTRKTKCTYAHSHIDGEKVETGDVEGEIIPNNDPPHDEAAAADTAGKGTCLRLTLSRGE